jgi:hypothetical protein
LWLHDHERNAVMLVRDGMADASGAFAFRDVDWLRDEDWGSRFFVLVARQGEAQVGVVPLRGKDVDPRKLVIPMRVQSAVRGIVRDDGGTAVAGALVRVFYMQLDTTSGVALAEATPPWKATTRNDGTFVLAGVPADTALTLLVEHPDFAQTRIEVARGDRESQHEAVVTPGARIAGRVRHADGRPAVRVRVQCQGTQQSSWGETTTDDEGRYELRSLVAEPYNVWAVADGLTVVAHDSLPTAAGERTEAGDLVLIQGGFVTGRFVDAATGEPVSVEGCYVGVYGPSRPRSGAAIVGARAQRDGTFRLRVAPGSNYVYVAAQLPGLEGPRDFTVDIVEGRETKVEFRVRQ